MTGKDSINPTIIQTHDLLLKADGLSAYKGMLSSSSQLGRCKCKADLEFLHPQLAAQLFYLLV